MTNFTITTELQIPYSADSTNIPVSWINDRSFSLSAHGLLYTILSYVEPGRSTTGAEISRSTRPDDLPLADLIVELVNAGYLNLDGPGRYRLVHPDRLPPWPA